MVDRLSVSRRSEIMSRIHGKNTVPEITVRRLIHSLGYRYRLHSKALPGTPDLVFAKKRKVIFVHGCFWHMHPKCPKGRPPKSKMEYWLPKLKENRYRDLRVQRELRKQKLGVLVIWQCELKDIQTLTNKVIKFLNN